ncbi:MAG: hypothetical protein FWF15_06720 [Oscillospiraceae bacterium]|nr:hypothetical protein [Oscillospiraceae bacterium]
MPKRIMERHASDNKYLHRDFHISGDQGIAYVGKNYGDEGVIDYLTRFVKNYYKPLIEKIKAEGLSGLMSHIEKIYEIEEASDALSISLNENILTVEIAYCPAIKFMLESGYEPSRWYIETTRTVNNVIAAESGFQFELIDYNIENGKALYRFIKE